MVKWNELNEGQQHEMRYLYGNMKGVIQRDIGDSLLALGLIERDGYYSKLTQDGRRCVDEAAQPPAPATVRDATAGEVPDVLDLNGLDYAMAMLGSEFVRAGNYDKVAHHFKAIDQWKAENEVDLSKLRVALDLPDADEFGIADVLEAIRQDREKIEAQQRELDAARAELARVVGERDAAMDASRRNLEWAYALMVELAVMNLDEANRTAVDNEWPRGQSWDDLAGSSRSAFMHIARKSAGITDAAWREVFEPEVDDRMVDIWERKQPANPSAASEGGG